MTIDWRTLQKEARERFHVRSFRPGQRELMEAVLSGRDALGLLPTGAGKSLTYQLPSLLLPHACVVVSPLIALMQDQQEKLAEVDIEAAKLDSTVSAADERKEEAAILKGRRELVYVTPERLENPEYLELLRAGGVSLVVVDEAHCISQWGHDFRPAFLGLRDAIRKLGRPPVLALTATATPEVEADIVHQLELRDPLVVKTELERPNLFFEVRRTVNPDLKREALLELVRAGDGTGIVYTATVRAAEELYRWLREEGIEAGRYHGKLRKHDREQIQQEFMEGAYPVIVATNAFGLGIDKPDIRFVAHWHFPATLEAYYQEVGRAGRDGKPARAVLLYRLEDKRVQSFFLGGKYPKREESLRVWNEVRRLSKEKKATIASLVEATGLSERRVKVIVAQLDGAGVIVRKARGIQVIREFENGEELSAFLSEYETRHSDDHEKLETMMHYAQGTGCRMRFIAEYFGEDFERECGHCDNCEARAEGRPPEQGLPSRGEIRVPRAEASPRARRQRLEKGQRVRHRKFGNGEVLETVGPNVHVKFADGEHTVRAGFLTLSG